MNTSQMFVFGPAGQVAAAEIPTPSLRSCRRCRRWFDEDTGEVVDHKQFTMIHFRNKVSADRKCNERA